MTTGIINHYSFLILSDRLKFDDSEICEQAWLFIMGFTRGDRTSVSQGKTSFINLFIFIYI